MAWEIIADIRAKISSASSGDARLQFALRRKIHKELMHDERSKPAQRNKIKAIRRKIQDNICPLCNEPLPEKNAVLDRAEAWLGYTVENTQLIHAQCDLVQQTAKGFT